MNDKRPFSNFKGTIDELLDHCSQIDPDIVENKDTPLTDNEAIDIIKEEAHCDDEEATEILQELKRHQMQEIFENLQEAGLIEVSHYDEDGDVVYILTEKGKIVYKETRSYPQS